MDSCSKSLHDSSTSPFDCLMFDLDDTLYSSKLGLGGYLKKNIDDFLVENWGFPKDKASSFRVELFKTYGSSLAGLRALGYDVGADDYHSVVHGRLPYHLIKPDSLLRNLLRSIPQRKVIFTNSDRIHATKALQRLGIEDCFDQIICFETMNPSLSKATRPDEFPIVLKPSLEAMKIALRAASVNPHRTLFLDDSVRNVTAGKAVGLRTVLVGKGVKTQDADYAVEAINSLATVVPEVWIGGDNKEDNEKRTIGSRSDMDCVLGTTATVGA